MRLRLERLLSDSEATIGVLYRENIFECFTLEDEKRTVKVWGETRIPAGTYVIKLRDEGGMNGRYGKKFPSFHLGMLWLQEVDNFKLVYLHIGNTDDDTAGCILVGRDANTSRGNLAIFKSTRAYVALYNAVLEAAKDAALTIEIIDERREK